MRWKRARFHQSFGGRRVRHREDDEVGARQKIVQRVGLVQLRDAWRVLRSGARRWRAPSCRTRRRRRAVSAPMPPTPTMSAVASGRCTTPRFSSRLLPFAPELLRDIDMQATRESQHEGHDVRADMVVEDFPEVGHDEGVFDQLRIVVAGGGCGLRRLQPAQPPSPSPAARCGSQPNAASASTISRSAAACVFGDHHAHVGHRSRRVFRPQSRATRQRRQHDELEAVGTRHVDASPEWHEPLLLAARQGKAILPREGRGWRE